LLPLRLEGAAYLAALAAAFLFAFNGIVILPLARAGLVPMLLLACRFWLAWLGLTAFFVVWRRRPHGIRGHFKLIVAFAALLSVTHLSFLIAVAVLPIAVVLMIGYTAPALLLAVESLVMRQRPNAPTTAAFILALFGAALVIQPAPGQQMPVVGVSMAVLQTFAYAAYLWLAGRVPRELDTRTLLWWTWLFASLGTAPFALLNLSRVGAGQPFLLLYLGLGGTLLAFLLIIAAVRRMQASRVAIVAIAEVPIAAVSAFVFLGQSLGVLQILGGVGVAAAVALIYLGRASPAQTEVSAPGAI
jgi:drug/metabolite transporter (DMT)-like permease